MLVGAALLFVTTALASSGELGDADFKQVAAPPSDITSGLVRLPAPEACATDSRATFAPVELARVADGEWSGTVPVAVPGTGATSLALLVVDSTAIDVDVRGARGEWLPLERATGAQRESQLQD